MTITTRAIDYTINGKDYEAFLAAPKGDEPSPLVIVCHAWAGRSQYENDKAHALADLGYTAVAIDLFGKGVKGGSKEECQALIQPFIEDRAMLQDLLKANIAEMKTLPEADATKIAVVGYCFGGLCALDAARSGAEAAGVVSVHGLLNAPGNTIDKIEAKVLALHGWADPMATPDSVVAFGEEMDKAKADWQIHGYGGVMHAFTNPAANDPDFGTVFDEKADKRSWASMRLFLTELFA